MFGLSFEKLLLAGIIAVIVIGPSRLPHYAQRFGEFVLMFKAHVESLRSETSLEAGDWQALDPRQYDPRRIVRAALSESRDGAQEHNGTQDVQASDPGGRIVADSSGHPRRVRRVAAASVTPVDATTVGDGG